MSDQSEEKVVYSFPRGRDSEIRFRRVVFNGKPYADVRLFIADADDVDHPTKKVSRFPRATSTIYSRA